MAATSGKADTKTKRKPKPLARVLVVEDDAVLALALEDAFLDAGTSDVLVCQSMKATMRALETGPRPDALVLDVHLADRDDGWAIAELVGLLGPRPPLIAFSTASPEDIPANIASMGCIFEKPYDPDMLVSALSAGRKKGFFARLLR